MLIQYHLKDRRTHQFSSYQEALKCAETPTLISIQDRETDPTQLIHFLKKHPPPQPQVVLARSLTIATDIQFLINNFNVFRIVPYQTSQKDLQALSLQALQRHQNSETKMNPRSQTTPTEESNLEKHLLESAKMAELGAIGSHIAHELNNPLGGMISFLTLIKMDTSEEDPHYTDLLKMQKYGQQCKKTVENLLSLSRPYNLSEFHPIDLTDAIKQSLQIIQIKTDTTNIYWDLDLPDEPIKINGQSHLLIQAIYNILQNAIGAIFTKAATSPTYRGLIKVELQDPKEMLILLINDNGTGIPDAAKAKVLRPLFSTEKSKSHVGLGLTVAHQIISEHNGKLDIHSHPKHGTTVKISFKRPD